VAELVALHNRVGPPNVLQLLLLLAFQLPPLAPPSLSLLHLMQRRRSREPRAFACKPLALLSRARLWLLLTLLLRLK